MDNTNAARVVAKARMAKRRRIFARKYKPPKYDVVIEVKVNGRTIVGPIYGQDLAIVAKYSGNINGKINLLDGVVGSWNLEMTAQYED